MGNNLLPDSVEPDFYPDSHVFVNKLDTRDYKLLKSKEADITFLRSLELLQSPAMIEQTYDFAHLKKIHAHLFQDLYAWAGRPRSYDVSKGGDIFTPAAELGKYEQTVFARSQQFVALKIKPNPQEAAVLLAKCLGILNIYHPFPEGNGRTQRIFLTSVANCQQYYLDWSKVFAWEMVETSKLAHVGEYDALTYMIERILKSV